MQKQLKILVCVTTIILIGVSCSPQKKFASEFVSKSSKIKVMVLSPEIVYKNNLNTKIVDSLKITDEVIRDSLLWEQSVFFSHINDSLFIANYVLGYKTELAKYGIKIFDQESADSFFSEDSNAYLINIAQLEVEEEDYEYRDETEYYNYVYFHDHLFKAININTWFEINELNDDSISENMFYATNTITDDLNSSFDFNVFSEKVEYIYEVDSLTLPKIYEYTYLLGRIYATYTFDFMMNRYINKKQGTALKKEELLRYNPNTRTFFFAGENRFISMDE